MKNLMTVLLLACCVFLLSSCGSGLSGAGNSEDDGRDPQPQELKLMFFGDKPSDIDDVLREFERRTKDTLHLKLNMEWAMNEELKQKLKLKLAAGEEVDAVFDAPWLSLEQNVAQGYYYKLDRYFNNDDYPGLKKAFPPEFLETNKINGHLYTVPLTQFFYDIEVVYIRKDLREKLGLAPVRSYEELQAYLDAVSRAYPDMIPFALKGDRGFFKLFANEDKQTRVRMVPNSIAGTGISFEVVLSQDGKRVLGAATYGDPSEAYAAFPAPYSDPDYGYEAFDRYVEWNKYIQKDVLNERSPQLLFLGGKSAANESTLSAWLETRQKLQTSIPGAELEGFVYSACQRNMEQDCIGTDYRAWNNLVIPVTSKHVDETMKFLDWLFQSQDNHDLFELGIKGEHWKEAGDGMYKSLPAATNYLFPRYEMTWNPGMSRISADNVPEAVDLLRYSADPKTYYRLPLAGFRFDPTPVRSDIAKVQPVAEQMLQVFRSGLDPDWRTTAAKTNQKLRKLGLEKIRSELIKQVQAYLDAGGT